MLMHRKKLFYVPGLISLLGLPVLFFFLGPEDPVYHTVLRIRLPEDTAPPDGLLSTFNKAGFLHTVKDKKLISVDINDCPFDDRSEYELKRKLAFVPREIERLQFTSDTDAVFRLRFGEYNTYGQFIWALTMARIYDFRRYAFFDDDLYFLPNPAPERTTVGTLDVVLPFSDNVIAVHPYTPPTRWELFTRRFSRWWAEVLFDIRQNHWLIIGFLLFILVPGLIKARNRILKV